jgi:hypothetical protein
MKCPRLSLIIWAVLAISSIAGIAFAGQFSGETEWYLKPGYFALTETTDGHQEVAEKGLVVPVGIAYTQHLTPYLSVRGNAEIYLGAMYYDGFKVADKSPVEAATGYVGVREELSAAAHIPLGDHFSIGPMAGVGHRVHFRAASVEVWNYLYDKVGGNIEWNGAQIKVTAEAGAFRQIMTDVYVNWSYAGQGWFTTRPTSKTTPFAEIKITKGKSSFGAYYEAVDWGQSKFVAIKGLSRNNNGVVRVDTLAYQPDTTSTTIGLIFSYSF